MGLEGACHRVLREPDNGKGPQRSAGRHSRCSGVADRRSAALGHGLGLVLEPVLTPGVSRLPSRAPRSQTVLEGWLICSHPTRLMHPPFAGSHTEGCDVEFYIISICRARALREPDNGVDPPDRTVDRHGSRCGGSDLRIAAPGHDLGGVLGAALRSRRDGRGALLAGSTPSPPARGGCVGTPRAPRPQRPVRRSVADRRDCYMTFGW